MASRIKGITIEIEGKTTGLENALRGVNKTLGSTQSALRDVDKLLKLDPKNTELLEQKQRLLQEAISGTSEKLDALKRAEVQAKKQLESGELGRDKYEALQREIISTEGKLDDLKEKAKDADSALQNSTSGLDNLSTSAEKMSGKLSGASKAAGTLLAGVAATVPATQELRRDLSFLYQNAELAGVGITATKDAFKKFNAVSGETDSSVEAVSNLLQAGFTQSNLEIAVEGLAGAATRFPDTLKIEGLADGLQETLATGKAIGPFAELLDRLGIGADKFSEDLAKCTTEAEKQDLALKTMADAGLMDSYEAWSKNNKELTEYEDSVIEMQMALSDLAKTISPLVTKVSKFTTQFVKGFNELSPVTQKALLGLTGVVAVSSPTLSAVGKMSSGAKALSEAYKKVTTSTTGVSTASKGLKGASSTLFSVMKAHPYVAAAAGAAALAVAIYKVVKASNEETNAAEKAIEENRKHIQSIESQYQTTESYAKKLDELTEKENKSAQDKEMIQAYVDKLNGSIDGLNLTYDVEADKLNKTTEEIYKKIDAMKQEALQAAYIKHSQKALESYTDSQIKLTEAQEHLADVQKKFDDAASSGYVSQQLSKDLADAKAEVNDLTGATKAYWQEYVTQSNQAAIASGQWDDLVKEAEKAGIDVPKGFKKGIESGEYVIPESIDELEALINFDKSTQKAGNAGQSLTNALSAKMRSGEATVQEANATLNSAIDFKKAAETAGLDGQAIINNLAGKVDSGKITVQEANNRLNEMIEFSQAVQSADMGGTNIATRLSTKIRNGKITASEATKQLTNAVENQTNAAANRSGGTGSKLGRNFATGLSGQTGASRTSGQQLGNAAKAGAGTVDFYNVGYNDGKGYSRGLRGAIQAVADAGAAIADAAMKAAKKRSQQHSPSKAWKRIAKYDVRGYTDELKHSVPAVEKAGSNLSAAALKGASQNNISGTDMQYMKSKIVHEMNYSAIQTAMQAAVSGINLSIVLDQRELGRGLRGMGVQFK